MPSSHQHTQYTHIDEEKRLNKSLEGPILTNIDHFSYFMIPFFFPWFLSSDCARNKPVYEVINLNTILNVDRLTEQSKWTKLNLILNEFQVNISNLQISTPHLNNQLVHISVNLNIDFSQHRDVVSSRIFLAFHVKGPGFESHYRQRVFTRPSFDFKYFNGLLWLLSGVFVLT